jgi:hypothetical protein
LASSQAPKVRNVLNGATPQISPTFSAWTIAECADDANGVAAQLINGLPRSAGGLGVCELVRDDLRTSVAGSRNTGGRNDRGEMPVA